MQLTPKQARLQESNTEILLEKLKNKMFMNKNTKVPAKYEQSSSSMA